MKNCILIHLYYSDLWEEFKPFIVPILERGNTDLFITYTNFDNLVQDASLHAKKTFLVENRGLDIGPFIYFLNEISLEDYSVVTKIHTKKSLHHGREESFGEEWRKNLYLPLIYSPEIYEENVEIILKSPGLLGSKKYFYTPEDDYNNFLISDLEEKIDRVEFFLEKKFKKSPFIAGSIYMISSCYLKKLFTGIDLGNLYYEFELGYQTGNLISHAFERIFGYGIEKYNFKINLV